MTVVNRMLIVGAGASLEECQRSGQYPSDPSRQFPLVRNFCAKLFDQTSSALMRATASYLSMECISFNPRLLSLQSGDSFTSDEISEGPVGTFLQLEAESPDRHNIERLCEHVWKVMGDDIDYWISFVHDGIYLNLFALFTEQFGLGRGREMRAGRIVADSLASEDVVLNLNYDIAFDLALKQSGKSFSYAPIMREGTIAVMKPHGSFNIFINPHHRRVKVFEPDRIPGSFGIPDPEGGVFFAEHGIVPPRLHKDYTQHPVAQRILNAHHPIQAQRLTFWGVGLTDSDVDLLTLYKRVSATADTVEFINPSAEVVEKAEALLGRTIRHYNSLERWKAEERK